MLINNINYYKLYQTNKDKIKIKKELKKINIFLAFFIIYLFILIYLIADIILKKKKNQFHNDKNLKNYITNKNINSSNKTFAIISRPSCITAGLLSYYFTYLACVKLFLDIGYIPIIDTQSFPNILNGFNISSSTENSWEIFFNQPFGYKLRDVKNNIKNIKYLECKTLSYRPNIPLLLNKRTII